MSRSSCWQLTVSTCLPRSSSREGTRVKVPTDSWQCSLVFQDLRVVKEHESKFLLAADSVHLSSKIFGSWRNTSQSSCWQLTVPTCLPRSSSREGTRVKVSIDSWQCPLVFQDFRVVKEHESKFLLTADSVHLSSKIFETRRNTSQSSYWQLTVSTCLSRSSRREGTRVKVPIGSWQCPLVFQDLRDAKEHESKFLLTADSVHLSSKIIETRRNTSQSSYWQLTVSTCLPRSSRREGTKEFCWNILYLK
jgi:hypothetical protein